MKICIWQHYCNLCLSSQQHHKCAYIFIANLICHFFAIKSSEYSSHCYTEWIDVFCSYNMTSATLAGKIPYGILYTDFLFPERTLHFSPWVDDVMQRCDRAAGCCQCCYEAAATYVSCPSPSSYSSPASKILTAI